jgi:uncharacterized membrane protein
MLPEPLHPAVVHLPIALAVLIPGLAILGVFLIHRKLVPLQHWALIVLLQAVLVGCGWLALETGEAEEDRVERVVAERHIETHEEAAERFLLLAGIGLLASAAGLLPRRTGALGRIAGTLATFAVLAAGMSVGHSGGELVYEHGAASAYIESSGEVESARASGHFDDEDDDD